MSAVPMIEKTHLVSRILMGCILCFGVLSAILTLHTGATTDYQGHPAETSGLLTLSSAALKEFQAEVSQTEALREGIVEAPAKNATQPEPSVPEAERFTFSSQAELIRAIQTELARLGYDTGTPDGMMGPRTRKAIRQFETDEGSAESGEPSVSLYQKLVETADSAY